MGSTVNGDLELESGDWEIATSEAAVGVPCDRVQPAGWSHFRGFLSSPRPGGKESGIERRMDSPEQRFLGYSRDGGYPDHRGIQPGGRGRANRELKWKPREWTTLVVTSGNLPWTRRTQPMRSMGAPGPRDSFTEEDVNSVEEPEEDSTEEPVETDSEEMGEDTSSEDASESDSGEIPETGEESEPAEEPSTEEPDSGEPPRSSDGENATSDARESAEEPTPEPSSNNGEEMDSEPEENEPETTALAATSSSDDGCESRKAPPLTGWVLLLLFLIGGRRLRHGMP